MIFHRLRCPGWILVNVLVEPEIQACDRCRTMTDAIASTRVDARAALHNARTTLAAIRARAARRRRMAIQTAVGALTSPCCQTPVTVWGIYQTTDLTNGMRGTPEQINVTCGACQRSLNVPDGIDLNVEFTYP